MAVISGRQPRRSTQRAGRRTAPSATATATEAMMPPMSISGSTQTWSGEPSRVKTVREPKAPIMKISPWAKLISWMIP